MASNIKMTSFTYCPGEDFKLNGNDLQGEEQAGEVLPLRHRVLTVTVALFSISVFFAIPTVSNFLNWYNVDSELSNQVSISFVLGVGIACGSAFDFLISLIHTPCAFNNLAVRSAFYVVFFAAYAIYMIVRPGGCPECPGSRPIMLWGSFCVVFVTQQVLYRSLVAFYDLQWVIKKRYSTDANPVSVQSAGFDWASVVSNSMFFIVWAGTSDLGSKLFGSALLVTLASGALSLAFLFRYQKLRKIGLEKDEEVVKPPIRKRARIIFRSFFIGFKAHASVLFTFIAIMVFSPALIFAWKHPDHQVVFGVGGYLVSALFSAIVKTVIHRWMNVKVSLKFFYGSFIGLVLTIIIMAAVGPMYGRSGSTDHWGPYFFFMLCLGLGNGFVAIAVIKVGELEGNCIKDPYERGVFFAVNGFYKSAGMLLGLYGAPFILSLGRVRE